MRHFTTIAFLFFRAAFSFGQTVNDDLSFFSYSYDKDKLKNNKVETVTIEMILPSGKKSSKSVYHFNEEGLLDKQIIQDKKGIILREFYFRPNSHKDLISRIQKDYQYKRNDTVQYFKYYKDDYLIRDSSSEMPISYCYEYNSEGGLTKTVINSNFDLGNKAKRVIINKLDSLGRVSNSIETVFQTENDSTGTLFSDRDFYYYPSGKLEKEIEKLNSGYSRMANKGSINYEYDSGGNLIGLMRTNAASYIYTYNEKGLILTKRMKLETYPDAFENIGVKMEAFDKYTYTFRQ